MNNFRAVFRTRFSCENFVRLFETRSRLGGGGGGAGNVADKLPGRICASWHQRSYCCE